MKLAVNQIDAFINKPDQTKFKAALIYGPDTGQVSLRRKTLVQKLLKEPIDPFALVEFSYNKVKDELFRIADEMTSTPLTGSNVVIILKDIGSAIDKILVDMIASINPGNNNFLIIEAGDLTTTSSLRKSFETLENAVAIPCYKDDAQGIIQIVRKKISDAGFNYEPDVPMLLATQFGGDRLLITNEIDKLLLYMGNDKNIKVTDIETIIVDSGENSFDALCNAIGTRDAKNTSKELEKAFQEALAPVALISIISRHFQRLYLVKNRLEQGLPEQQAMALLRPPVFFKQVPIFKRQLQLWNSSALIKVLDGLLELEAKCKSTGMPAELLLARFLAILPTIR